MAQRTIHMLFAALLLEKMDVSDQNRFFLGSILPDSYTELSARKVSHFIRSIPEENRLFIDFPCFRDSFGQEMMKDDLYLGYYAHLVEDAFYRFFLYYDKGFMSRMSRTELDFLHADYRILNSYIAGKYDLPKHLEYPGGIEKEPISRITGFDAGTVISEYEKDVAEKVAGKTMFLTESILEEFIGQYIDLLADELRSVKIGSSILSAPDYRWENRR